MPSTFMARKGPDVKTGSVTALVSAYGVRYQIGWGTFHTIQAGAFAESIKAQESIPLFWAHSWNFSEQPPIGHATASEGADGLEVDGELYIDTDPSIARVHAAMMAGALREWSIGYRVLAEEADPDDSMHTFVTKGELLEASVVLRGANPATDTLKVASAVLGRELSDDELTRLARILSTNHFDTAAAPAPPADDLAAAVRPDLWDRLATVRKLGIGRSE